MKTSHPVNSGQRKAQTASTLRSILEAPLQLNDPLTSPLVGDGPLTRMRINPTSAIRLAHGKLHSYYPFSEVPLCWRRSFEEACLWRVLALLESSCEESSVTDEKGQCNDGNTNSEVQGELDFDDEIIRLCDDAIVIVGAPGRRSLIDEILSSLDECLEEGASTSLFSLEYEESLEENTSAIDAAKGQDDDDSSCLDTRPAKRPRRSSDRLEPTNQKAASSLGSFGVPSSFPASDSQLYEHHLTSQTARRSAPSLVEFDRCLSSTDVTPFVITNALGHWPALTRWRDPRYWLYRTHHGRRRVPVEWGRSYVDEGWGQSIVPFDDFLQDVLLETGKRTNIISEEPQDTAELQEKGKRKRTNGYLAQHDILGQIPALRNDIAIPDYCYCSAKSSAHEQNKDGADESSDEDEVDMINPALNIWLGPAGTVSPAHTDPHHNLLAQVFGRKYVRLFSPAMEPHMYPMSSSASSHAPDTTHDTDDKVGTDEGGYSMSNTSSVDVGLEVSIFSASSSADHTSDSLEASSEGRRLLQRSKYPTFHASAKYVECILEPGEMLFIPRGWWHYVRSLEVSCNVSFWWD